MCCKTMSLFYGYQESSDVNDNYATKMYVDNNTVSSNEDEMSRTLNMNNGITNLKIPTNNANGATKKYVDDSI